MGARLLDGQALGKRIQQDEIKPQVAEFTARYGRPPGRAIVLVGENPASEVYVRNKLKSGSEVGFRADLERLPATASLAEVLALVDRLTRLREELNLNGVAAELNPGGLLPMALEKRSLQILTQQVLPAFK